MKAIGILAQSWFHEADNTRGEFVIYAQMERCHVEGNI